jgi:TolB-like protein
MPFSDIFTESIIGVIAAIVGFRVIDRAIMQVLFIFSQEWTDSCDEEIRFTV